MIRLGLQAAELQQWSRRQRLLAIKRIIPQRKVEAALRRRGKERRSCPRTPDGFMIWFVVALALFCSDSYCQIFRWLVPRKLAKAPRRSTLCMARQRVGVMPLVRLAAQLVKLLAEPQTPGAFYQGMRLMAVDGFAVNLPDTPANQRAFGRPVNGRSPGAFPQAQALGLMEVGTHVFWRWRISKCNTDETRVVPALLKCLQENMLLLWDRGLAAFDLVRQVRQRGAHLLAHWKINRILPPVRVLKDGSYLSRLYRNDSDRRAGRDGIDVRVIEYTLDDPARAGCGQIHRLLTTLLDARRHPAQTLVELYHLRWEEELAIDELKTHEMEREVLRSQTPAGAVQEIYGLLLGHYVLRTLMHEAAKRTAISPTRISFTATLKIVRCRLPEYSPDPRKNRKWWRSLLEEIADEQLPPRRNRIYPRVIKRQQSPWPTKRAKHRNPPQPTRSFKQAIVIVR